MNLSIRAKVELFHLLFLRQFERQIDSQLYAIKGGCNLRFFFNSCRYSEDLDIDIQTINPETLEAKVNKILSDRPLASMLATYGVASTTFTTPKQTQTTQRWKVSLHLDNSTLPLPTKIEFSRRKTHLNSQFENVNLTVCQQYRLSPMRLSHYGHDAALIQKVDALALRTETQARDVFDIYQLLHFANVPDLQLNSDHIELAKNALLAVSFDDYHSQVASFLELEQQVVFKDEQMWQNMLDEVMTFLDGQQS